MTDLKHLPKVELTGQQLQAREDCEHLEAILASEEFSPDFRRVFTLQTCELCRLEDQGRVRQLKDFYE